MVFRTILVAHDFSEPADRALSMAAHFAQTLHAKLHILHVHKDLYDGRADDAAGIPWPTTEQTARYLRFLHEELLRVVRNVAPELQAEISYHVLRGEPEKRIAATADEIEADLICLGSTGKGAVDRTLMGSVSQRIVRTSKIPVLTVH
jgi:nucleotide-binding universal stress UspA family protein